MAAGFPLDTKPGGYHSAVIQYQQIAVPKAGTKLRKGGMHDPSPRSVDDHQSARRSIRKRRLCDKFRRQRIVIFRHLGDDRIRTLAATHSESPNNACCALNTAADDEGFNFRWS